MNVRKKLKILGIITCVLVLIGVYYIRVSEFILDVGDTDAEAILTLAVYSVLSEMSAEQISSYEDFFTIIKNPSNEISAVLTNGVIVNVFTSKMAVGVSGFLLNYSDKGVAVPIGAFSGIKLFSGMGKRINVKLLEISSVKCNLKSSFEQAGINQVKHSLYAEVEPDVTIKAIGRNKQVSVSVSVLLYENVIVGKVPDTYLDAEIIH